MPIISLLTLIFIMQIDYGVQFLSQHPTLVNPSMFLVSLITRIKEALSLITAPFFIKEFAKKYLSLVLFNNPSIISGHYCLQ